MADAAAAAGFWVRHDFLLRRLHSLAGLVPLTLFMLEHTFTNLKATQGPEAYHGAIDFLSNLPGLFVIEVLFIFLPLAFHGLYGLVIYFSGQGNVRTYRYRENWRYAIQRWSGLFVLLFVTYHVLTWRFGVVFPGQVGGPALLSYNTVTGHPLSFYEALHQSFASLPLFIFYLLGLAATMYHLANGLWTFAITWGLTRSQRSQKAWSRVCVVLGVVLFVAGTLCLVALRTSQRVGIIQHARPLNQLAEPAANAAGAAAAPAAPTLR